MVFCQRVAYCDHYVDGKPEKTRVILGIIIDDTDQELLHVRTARNDYRLNKKFVLSIVPTRDEFKEDR